VNHEEFAMNKRVRFGLLGAMLAASAFSSAGCQTYQAGQVMPTPYYFRDDIQYYSKGDQFPLQNELNAMQAAEAERER
jgi:hypothetical protein